MNIKFFLILFLASLFTACGGGGGGSSYSSSSSSSSDSGISNLNPTNACKKAWYTSMPAANSSDNTFNNYSFFWQATSFENLPICKNYYEATTSISSVGGIPWKGYVEELLEYSKNTLGQIVPVNVFVLGANPQNSVTASEKATYNTDFATVQAPLSNYSNALANYDGFPIESAGGGYSHEAAPNGADIQIPQSLVWGQAGFANDAEEIQQSLKIIAHEYFHVYQNSIKFYNETTKNISLPKAWFSNPSLIDSPTIPAYFPWYIEEGGAEFGGIILSAKYANTKPGINVDPVQQLRDHFNAAHTYFNGGAGRSLADFNLTGNIGYSAGAAALLYLWYKDERNFNSAMTRYYTSWQEAESVRPSNGWQDAFEDAFFNGNGNDYYTLSSFVSEFDSWITNPLQTQEDLWNTIAKTSDEIVHADVVPTTVNTPNSASKTIEVLVDSNPFGAGNRYFIDGVLKKTLVVKAGQTYKFNIPAISSHPFKFSTNVNGQANPGDEYTTGVSVVGTEVTIAIPSSGVSALYYYCGIHAGMGGKIVILDQAASGGGILGGGGLGGGGGSGY